MGLLKIKFETNLAIRKEIPPPRASKPKTIRINFQSSLPSESIKAANEALEAIRPVIAPINIASSHLIISKL